MADTVLCKKFNFGTVAASARSSTINLNLTMKRLWIVDMLFTASTPGGYIRCKIYGDSDTHSLTYTQSTLVNVIDATIDAWDDAVHAFGRPNYASQFGLPQYFTSIFNDADNSDQDEQPGTANHMWVTVENIGPALTGPVVDMNIACKMFYIAMKS